MDTPQPGMKTRSAQSRDERKEPPRITKPSQAEPSWRSARFTGAAAAALVIADAVVRCLGAP